MMKPLDTRIIDELDGFSRAKKKLVFDTLDAVCKVVKTHCKTDMED